MMVRGILFSAPMMAYVVPDVAPTHLHDGAGSDRAAVQRKAPVGTLRCAARTNKNGKRCKHVGRWHCMEGKCAPE